MRKLIKAYRLLHGEKISSFRLLAYAAFGLAASGVSDAKIYFVDILIVFFGILGASYFNDYYDWKMLGEKNGVSELYRKNLLYGILPALAAATLLALFFFLKPSFLAYSLLWISFFLSMAYSIPPARLKERKLINIIVPPFGIFFLFFQGFTLLQMPSKAGWMIAAIVLVFAWYLEFLHLVDDSLQEHEVSRVGTARSMAALKASAVFGALAGLIFLIFGGWLFLASIAAWFLRFIAVLRKSPMEIVEARRNILDSVWRLEEFAVYAVVGIINMLHI